MTLGMDGSNRGLLACSIIETKDELEEVVRSFNFFFYFWGVGGRLRHYTLVICNNGPPPTPGGGRGIAVEISGVFTLAVAIRPVPDE